MERVNKVLFSAIDDINHQLDPAHQLEKRAETVLSGQSAKLDSLDFVELMVNIEQGLQLEFEVSLVLGDAAAMEEDSRAFRTLKTLGAHIHERLRQAGLQLPG